MNRTRKVILFIAVSLDGYIATKENGLEFLSLVEDEGQDYSYTDFVNSVDTVIVGRKSYEKVLSMAMEYPLMDKNVYVVTHTPKTSVGSIQYFSGDLKQLVLDQKSKEGKNIYVDGGAEIVNEMLQDNLIDEFYISIIPTLLGTGIPLFKNDRPEQTLKLISTKTFNKGLVQLHYAKA